MALEESERLARQQASTAERTAGLREEQYHEARRMAGIITLSSSSSASNNDAFGAADAYVESSRRDPKGKCWAWRKW